MEWTKVIYAGASVVGVSIAEMQGLHPGWAVTIACLLGTGLSALARFDAKKSGKKTSGWRWITIALASGFFVGLYGSLFLMIEWDMPRDLRAPVAFMLSAIGAKIFEGVVELDFAKMIKGLASKWGG